VHEQATLVLQGKNYAKQHEYRRHSHANDMQRGQTSMPKPGIDKIKPLKDKENLVYMKLSYS